MSLEIGVFGFGETVSYPRRLSPATSAAQRLAEVTELAVLAESVGLDMFGVGEHHREEFAISAPAVVLAAIAARTTRIRLASALTVLATEDPVRIFEQFATVDSLSRGRVEVMVGRDSFPDAFPLFGHRLTDEEWLFDEKLRLLLMLASEPRVTWSGDSRPALRDARVVPRPVGPLPIGVISGRSPRRGELAGRLGVPLSVLMHVDAWESYLSMVQSYRHAFLDRRDQAAAPHVSAMLPAHVAATGTLAAEQAYPFSGPSRPAGTAIVGDPDQVVERLLELHALLHPQRMMLEVGRGSMPHAHAVRAVELLGTEVAPAVRRALA